MNVKKLRKPALALLGIAALGSAIWALVWWARYPKTPDVRNGDLDTSIAFMATDNFNRLTESHRKRYTQAVIEKHRELAFPDLLRRAMDRSKNEQRRQIVKNVRAIPGGDGLGTEMFGLFIDKFYQLPEEQRNEYLTMMVFAQQTEIKKRAKEMGLPSPDRLAKEMTRVMSSTPPQTQARMGQFMLDMKKTRQQWGIKDPI